MKSAVAQQHAIRRGCGLQAGDHQTAECARPEKFARCHQLELFESHLAALEVNGYSSGPVVDSIKAQIRGHERTAWRRANGGWWGPAAEYLQMPMSSGPKRAGGPAGELPVAHRDSSFFGQDRRRKTMSYLIEAIEKVGAQLRRNGASVATAPHELYVVSMGAKRFELNDVELTNFASGVSAALRHLSRKPNEGGDSVRPPPARQPAGERCTARRTRPH
jgi:hypothetical protein